MFSSCVPLAVKNFTGESTNAYFPTSHWIFKDNHLENKGQVYHDSFCQSDSSVSLPWVIYFEAFYLHVVSSFSCIPVICSKFVLFLAPLQFGHLFCNLSKCVLLFSCISEMKYMRRTDVKLIKLNVIKCLKILLPIYGETSGQNFQSSYCRIVVIRHSDTSLRAMEAYSKGSSTNYPNGRLLLMGWYDRHHVVMILNRTNQLPFRMTTPTGSTDPTLHFALTGRNCIQTKWT